MGCISLKGVYYMTENTVTIILFYYYLVKFIIILFLLYKNLAAGNLSEFFFKLLSTPALFVKFKKLFFINIFSTFMKTNWFMNYF